VKVFLLIRLPSILQDEGATSAQTSFPLVTVRVENCSAGLPAGFYETAGIVKVFVFVFAFVFPLVAFLLLLLLLPFLVSQIHLGLLYALAQEPLWTRCLMGPDRDETGLLSVARPMTAQPANAVTRTRDGWAFAIAKRKLLFLPLLLSCKLLCCRHFRLFRG